MYRLMEAFTAEYLSAVKPPPESLQDERMCTLSVGSSCRAPV